MSAYDYIHVVDVDDHGPHKGHPTVTTMIVLGCNSEGRQVFVCFSDCCHNVGAGALDRTKKVSV